MGGTIGVNFACDRCDGSEAVTNGNIIDSTINGTFIGVLLANSDDATITNNNIINGVKTVCPASFCGQDIVFDSKGILIGFSSSVQITGTTITGNEISNTDGFGIGVSSTQTSASGIQINSNSITGSTKTEVENQASSGTLDASGNWFGTNTSTDVAAKVSSSNVDYTPFLDVGTDTDSATAGFQGDFSVLHVDGSSCGDTMDVTDGNPSTIIVDTDLDCTTTDGLIIGADNITIDLNSNTVTGVTCNGCYGIDNTNGFDDVTIKSGTINGFEQGVRGEGVTNYILDSLTFTGQTSSHAIDILDSASATIRDSTITIPTTSFLGPEAIRLESVASVQVTNVNVNGGFVGVNFACGLCDGYEAVTNGNIINSTINGAFIGVLLANSDDATITNNNIINGVTTVCSAPFCVQDAVLDSKGILIGFSNSVQITGTTITGNEISNTDGFGIIVSSAQTSASGIQINSNSITGSTKTEVENQASSGTLDASGNWFGTNTSTDVAAKVSSSNVDYTPFLDVGTDTDSATAGFQGDFSVLHVDGSSCGDTMDVTDGNPSTIIVDTDLDCTTTDGLIIGADNITIDLNSNTVTGVTCNGCYGIDNTNGFDDVTIKSGSIVGFNHGVHGRNNADRFVLDDLSFSGQTGTWWERYSIDIRDSTSVTVRDSSFTLAPTTFVGPEAIRLQSVGTATVTNVNVVGGTIGVNFACESCDGTEPTNGSVVDSTFDAGFIGVFLADTDDATITNNIIKNTVPIDCSIQDIDGDGVNEIDSDSVTNCEDYPYTQISMGIGIGGFNKEVTNVSITENQIFGNDGFGIKVNNAGAAVIDAIQNYWGHATGPTHSSNTNGKGDTVSDNVTFDPWYINAKKTNLSKDVTVTNSEIASANNNVKLESDSSTDSTAGQAVLPTGIDTIILSDTTVLDLVVNLQQATGAEENLIKIGGVDKDLKAFKIKDKVGVEVEFDLKSNKPSIGDKIVNIKKAVKLNSGIANQPIILKNSDFASATISIPDATTILAPDGWDGTIQPPKTGSSAGTAPSGFSVGGTVIEVGSPDVVLLFDTAVDVLLSGVTGNVGYKPAGSDTWVQITDTCGGTFASSDSPTFPGECFISDGTDTKIVTFHFTEFGSLNVKSGSGCVDCIKPVLQSNSLSSPDSNIFEGILKLDDSARNSASLFETGDTIDFELSFYEDRGAESLNHVALFTNIRGFDDRYDSNLYVEWDKGKPLKVYDPEGYLDDITNVSFAEHDTDVVMTFHLNFVKPMDVSHIVLYYWDYFRNSGLVTFEDAIVIIEPVEDVIAEFQTDEIIANDDTVNDSIDTSKKEESPVIPAWIKDNAGRWADGTLEDFTFTNGIQYLIQEKIIDVPTSPNVSVDPDDEIIEEEEEQEIPKWIKNSAKWWSEDMISEEEFVNAIQWLIANGVVVI